MSTIVKRRAVVSYENMSDELAAAFAEKYPKGYVDYFPDLVKYPKPDGTSFYAVTVEIPDAIYLVKIHVKTDDTEDLERWLSGEDNDDECCDQHLRRTVQDRIAYHHEWRKDHIACGLKCHASSGPG